MKEGINMSINYDLYNLINIIKEDSLLSEIADLLSRYHKNSCYIGAGSIAQTVWNLKTNKPTGYGIEDIDIIFYNKDELDENCETEIYNYLKSNLRDKSICLDIKNQARIHLWYKNKFGYDITPYISLESAVNTWPTTASAVAIRKHTDNDWEIYAPYGLDDLFQLKVKANNRQITEDIYNMKLKKWKTKWEELDIIDWQDEEIPIIEPEIIKVICV